MKKSVFIIGLALSVLFTAVYAQPEKKKMKSPGQEQENTGQVPEKKVMTPPSPNKEKQATTQSKASTFQGKFVSLADYMSGKTPAASYTDKDQPIVLVTGEGADAKIYFLYNADGTYAGSKMLSYTANKTVTVTGKAKVVNGLNMIYADNIQPAG